MRSHSLSLSPFTFYVITQPTFLVCFASGYAHAVFVNALRVVGKGSFYSHYNTVVFFGETEIPETAFFQTRAII